MYKIKQSKVKVIYPFRWYAHHFFPFLYLLFSSTSKVSSFALLSFPLFLLFLFSIVFSLICERMRLSRWVFCWLPYLHVFCMQRTSHWEEMRWKEDNNAWIIAKRTRKVKKKKSKTWEFPLEVGEEREIKGSLWNKIISCTDQVSVFLEANLWWSFLNNSSRFK